MAKATERANRFGRFMKTVIGPAQSISLAQYRALEIIPCPEVWDRYVETGRTKDGYRFELALDCFVAEFIPFRATATCVNASGAFITGCVERLTDGRWVTYDGTSEHARVAYNSYGGDLLPAPVQGPDFEHYHFSEVQTMGPGLSTYVDTGKSNHGKHHYLGESELDPSWF
jgi:hypothetical protein